MSLETPSRPEILQHLMRLTEDDRAMRFGARLGDDALARYVASLDFGRDSFIAARSPEGSLSGLAQVMPIGSDGAAAAEVAFSLDPAMRGKGLGTRLAHEAMAHARHFGIKRLIAQVCPSNAPMLTIFRRLGMVLVREDSDIVGTLVI